MFQNLTNFVKCARLKSFKKDLTKLVKCDKSGTFMAFIKFYKF